MEHQNRRYPRLKTFDYGAGGTFCITICTRNKEKIFGTVVEEEEAYVSLSTTGQLVRNVIQRILEAYPGVKLLTWVVMPNHIHLLLQIPNDNPVSLLTVIRSTKTLVTKQLGQSIWQRSFYEHVVRNEQDALRFWKYIDENPIKWTLDPYYE